MASNPFHLWLGINPEIQSPNHFELLGISPTEEDLQVIEQAARHRLKQLQQVDAGKHTAVLEKIQKRVKLAYAVLKDVDKRAEYLQKTGLTPAPGPTAQPVPPSANPNASSGQTSAPTDTAGPRSENLTAKDSSDAPIPMAIPLADDSDPPTAVPAPPTSIAEDETEPVVELRPADGAPSQVKIKPRPIGRRRSFFVPFLCSLFLVGGIVGITYLTMNYDQFFASQMDDDLASKNTKNAKLNSDAPATDDPDKASDIAAMPKSDSSPSADIADQNNDKTPDSPPSDISDVTNTLLGDRPTNLANGPDTSNNTATETKTDLLDFADQVRFRRYLTAAQRAILRRDKLAADMHLENATSLFLRFEDDPSLELGPEQSELPEVLDATVKVRDLVHGFWNQVISSAQSISGGQELEIAGKIIGFVEGTQEFVIIRSGGENIKYSFEKIPAGLAKIIADQGAKPDVPTWRMQQAAFYAVHKELDVTYGDKAKEKAKEAEPDGHDPMPINLYVDFYNESVGVPERQLEELTQEEITDELDSMRINSIDVRRRLRPDQAAAAVDTMLEASLATDDPRIRAVRVYGALLAARKSADAFLLLDTIKEYALWVVTDLNEEIEEGLLEIAKSRSEMTEAQKYRFCATVHDYLPQFMNRRAKDRLSRLAAQMSQQNKFGFRF